MIYINKVLITPTIFPDKTSQVWKLFPESIELLKNCNKFEILWEFEDEKEIIQVLQLIKLLNKLFTGKDIVLNCPYLIYGRQDKTVSNESCFALEVFCDTFKDKISELRTFDVHNPAFFENKKICPFKFTNTLPYDQIHKIIKDEEINLLIFPDDGASKRYPDLQLSEIASVSADKVRDQLTGEIVGLELPPITIGASILVVDDLCDGGRTFVELAKLINKYAPNKLVLYVSHGIFSKGSGYLRSYGYDTIYTKDGYVPY